MPPALALVPLAILLGAAPTGPSRLEIDVADVPGGPAACPSQEQVGEALEGHLPGVVARAGREPGPGTLHLALAPTSEGLARLTLSDATGALRLERELELPGHDKSPAPNRASSCAALAETVALIVERYMRHIGYHQPPAPPLVRQAPPPPPPVAEPPPSVPWGLVGLGLDARPPSGMPWRLAPMLMAAVFVGPVEVALRVGAELPLTRTVPMSGGVGTLYLLAFPARLSVGWRLALGPRLELVPAVAGGADLVRARTRGIGVTRHSSALEPVIEAGLTVRAALTRRFWIDVAAFQGIDLRPEEFLVNDPATGRDLTVLMTPRVYTRIGVNFGFFLSSSSSSGKN